MSEYTHQDAVADEVNVGAFGTYIIETEITKNGGLVAAINQKVEKRDKRTRRQHWETVDKDEDLSYDAAKLQNSFVNKSQIRLILETFRDNWKTWPFFKDRKELPKTLIFAKHESHASDIMSIAREVFGEGDEFCKKITYKDDDGDSNSVLSNFRNSYFPRIAVTVNKIATGTDVKAIEILLFMRDVRSENYFEQMLGRARRVLSKDELQQTSPTAESKKLGYVIVDAAGVTKSLKTTRSSSVEAKPSLSMKNLMQDIITGDTSEEAFSSLSVRLLHLADVLSEKESKKFADIAGLTMRELAASLMKAHDADAILSDCIAKNPDFANLDETAQEKIRKEIINARCKEARKPINKPEVRAFILEVRNANDQTIDPALDSLISKGFAPEVDASNEAIRKDFSDFVKERRDELDALQIIYNQSYKTRAITNAMIEELYDAMKKKSAALTDKRIFAAYESKGKSLLQKAIDIIQVVRFEYGQIAQIEPLENSVRRKYQKWIFNANKNKDGERGSGSEPFTAEQMKWLEMIRDHIAINGGMEIEDLELSSFAKIGGTLKYCQLFGNKSEEIISELNAALMVA